MGKRSLIALALCLTGAAGAQQPADAPPSLSATFVYLSREAPQDARGSLSEPVVPDYGWMGAKFGVSELNVNGRFVGGHFDLTKVVVPAGADLRAQARSVLQAHPALVVADLEAADLLAVADLDEAKDSVIVDARTSDDALRGSQCRKNVFHVLPSWEMRSYALSRFLIGKGWRRWLLLRGSTEDDHGYAAAMRQAAQAGGARIVAQPPLPATGPDDSSTQAQVDARIEQLTRTSSPYDLVLVMDSTGAIGEHVMFNTAAPQLVAGTQGLRAVAWDAQFRDFAARGFGFRFAQFASREMGERDYGNWLAATVLGEAVLRGGVTDAAGVRRYLQSSRFSVAAMKGEPLTFRRQNQQLRQPILLFGPKVLVAMAASEPAARSDAGAPPAAAGESQDSVCAMPAKGEQPH